MFCAVRNGFSLNGNGAHFFISLNVFKYFFIMFSLVLPFVCLFVYCTPKTEKRWVGSVFLVVFECGFLAVDGFRKKKLEEFRKKIEENRYGVSALLGHSNEYFSSCICRSSSHGEEYRISSFYGSQYIVPIKRTYDNAIDRCVYICIGIL